MLRAHISEDGREQSVREHLYGTAKLSEEYAGKIGCPKLGYLAGLLHDAGKLTVEFDRYLKAAVDKGIKRSEKLNHSAAGAWLLSESCQKKSGSWEQLTLQMICEVVLCHHGKLCDNYNLLGEDCYTKKLQTRKEIYYDEVKENFNKEICHIQDLTLIFEQAVEEIKRMLRFIDQSGCNKLYTIGLLVKYLYSCLIDADRYDTVSFMENRLSDPEKDNTGLWDIFTDRIDQAIDQLPISNELDRLRKDISQACKEAGELREGTYQLNCPTGSGKTYSSFRFALHHAKNHAKKRIFYIIPYMSIIDQNAESIKSIMGNDCLVQSSIFELHSAIITDNENEDFKLLTERLDAPVILTTMVRFLNTFFGGGAQNMRPIHHFQDSVIIFDEIQALPVKMISMFNDLINFLSDICKTTCILCTATQPLLHKTRHPIRLGSPLELIALDQNQRNAFKRVQLVDITKTAGYSIVESTELILEKAREEQGVMVVMNTKSSALSLFRAIQEECSSDLVYLSTWMCPAHRKAVIRELRERSECILVSTQLVEAGVDLDFPCVIRALSGMDSFVQAAGRCNRHGNMECKNVYLFNPDYENLDKLEDIKTGAECCQRLLREAYSDFMSEEVIKRYFELYFYRQKHKMSYPVSKESFTYNLYSLLSDNANAVSTYASSTKGKVLMLRQAFETAGSMFEVIEAIGKTVLVPYGEGADLIGKLIGSVSFGEKRLLLKEAQQYSITLTPMQIDKMGNAVHYYEKEGIYVLSKMYYDDKLGFTMGSADQCEYCGF